MTFRQYCSWKDQGPVLAVTLVIQSSVTDFLQSHQGNTLKQTIYVMYPGLATLSINYIISVSVPTVNMN